MIVLVKNCTKITFFCFLFFLNCGIDALSLHPSAIPGVKNICQMWTWLSSVNDLWDSCCLHESVLGFKDHQSLSKTIAEFCVEMAETSGKMAEISGNVLPVNFACNKGQKDCESLHWSFEYHLKNLISSSLWDQHVVLTTTLKIPNYVFSPWWRFWSANSFFSLKISPSPKFGIVEFSR